jgi:ATP/ADP translocase
MIRINSTCQKATIDGIEYRWGGGFGSLITSLEGGVKRNDVRMIGNIVFYAFSVENCGWKRLVSWSPQQDIDPDWIRAFKKAMFE